MIPEFESELDRKARERQEDLARLRGLRPIDDDFLRCLFQVPNSLCSLYKLTVKSGREFTSTTKF